jgi:beta-lactamase class A
MVGRHPLEVNIGVRVPDRQLMFKRNINIGLILIALILGWFGHDLYSVNNSKGEIAQVREDSSRFKYINPLIYIDNSHHVYEELNPLKEQLEEYTNNQIEDNKITKASVYYRDLNTGVWTGVNPDDKYVPASILKVATMMVYLREIEDNQNIMNERLLYKKNIDERQNYPPTYELEDGYYPVSKLLGQALVESDNAAERALSQARPQGYNELYAALRLPVRQLRLDDFMSPRDVSRIFRSLYSSTYLLNSYSEQALEFLTKTNFNKGITAAIDSDVQIAHKFGEHTVYHLDPRKTPDYQLHDCGIVYYPGNPYFICVMTEGKNLANQEKFISEISAIAYSFVKQ